MGVDEPGGADELLDHPPRVPVLVGSRRRGHEDGLGGEPLELVEPQRPVVERRREPEPVLDQGLLARAVAAVHAPELRDGHVAFVDEEQRVGRKVVEQGRRRLAGAAAREETRVVLDPLAVADLGHHLDVEPGPLLQALRLDELVFAAEHREVLDQFFLDRLDGLQHPLARRDVVALGIDREPWHAARDLPGQGIEMTQVLDFVVEEFDAHRVLLRLRRVHVDDLAAHPVRPAVQLDLVPRVLHLGEAPEDEPLVDGLAPDQVQDHPVVRHRIAEAVDRGHGGHDDAVAVLQQRLRGRQPHLLDVVVDRCVLLDVGVGGGDVGFRLVVVVVGDEVLDGVVGEELAHLAVELRGQGLVGGEHQGRPSRALDDLRHRERLSGAGDAEQGLVGEPGSDPLDEPVDRGGLVAGGGEVGDDGEGSGFHGCHRMAARSHDADIRGRLPVAAGARQGILTPEPCERRGMPGLQAPVVNPGPARSRRRIR